MELLLTSFVFPVFLFIFQHSAMEDKAKPSLPPHFKENWESAPSKGVPTTFKSDPEFKKIIEKATTSSRKIWFTCSNPTCKMAHAENHSVCQYCGTKRIDAETEMSLKDLLHEVNGTKEPIKRDIESEAPMMQTIRDHVAEIARLDKALQVVYSTELPKFFFAAV